jgi:uncharacterized OsmC-like protein
MATTTATQKLNGLDTTQMFETLEAIKGQPSLAQFNFRLKNKWKSGGHNQSQIQGFFGAGQEDTSRETPFEFDNGEPPILLGNNEGANPVEFLLHGLVGCVTTTTALHAAARGIKINSIQTEMDGDIDVQGLLALDDSVRPGYQAIRIKMHIDADCTEAELADLMNFAPGRSPVFDSVTQGVPVQVNWIKK